MRRALMFLLLCVLVMPGLVAAQGVDLPNTYTLESGAVANYPDGWQLQAYDNGREYLSSSDSIVNLFDPDLLEANYGIAETDLVAVTESFFPGWDYTENLTFDSTNVVINTVGGRELGVYDFTDAFGDQAVLIALRFNDGRVGMVVGLTYGGELTERDTILAIAQSFDYVGASKAPIDEAVQGATVGNGDGTTVQPGVFSFVDGTALTYDPNVWEVNEAIDDTLNIISSQNQMVLHLYNEAELTSAGINTLDDLMAYDFETLGLEESYAPDGVIPFRVAERDGLRYDYIATTDDGTQFEVLVILVPMENGNVVRMRAAPLTTLQLENLRQIIDVLNTINADGIPSTVDTPTEDIELLDIDGPFPQQHDFQTDAFVLSVFYPEDWEKVVEDSFTYFQSEQTRWVPGWFSPESQVERGLEVGNLADSIGEVFSPTDPDVIFDPSNVKIQKVENVEVARYDYVDTDDVGTYTNTIMAVNMGEDYIFLVHFFPRIGERTQEVQTVLDMFLGTVLTFNQ